MKAPGEMTDRELDEAVAEEVMGLTVAGWWPVVWTWDLVPEQFADPALMTVNDWRKEYIDEKESFLLEPFLLGPHRTEFGDMVPAYTTDARETERVMERVKEIGGFVQAWVGDIADGAECCLRREGRDNDLYVTVEPADDWKRAVCEAALLAVRGAAR